MLKKIIVIIAMLAVLALSFALARKTPNNNATATSPENQEQQAVEEALPEDTYTLNLQNLPTECSLNNSILCAVESAVKCTINPEYGQCDKKRLPKFIFMTDQSVNRPTEISFKFISKKPLPNNTVEIYTESNCNGTWFGLCEGTVIYVLAPDEQNADSWLVRDIYAVE